MSTIITVENLSKKYTIGHQKQGEYQTFRDSLSHGVKSIYQRLRHPFSPNSEDIDAEEFWALKDINFEVKQGDRIGIIGRNGAGKSTLLKILSRITHPTTGKIHIKGRVASLLEVGTGFHPELTGRENIFLNGAILGMTKNDIKNSFDEIVAFAEIEKFLDTPVKRYSSGMYVRLAFAVAAHLEPEILIVDEVLAVGDAEFQKKCLGKMGEVSKDGRTILFVSHNMAAIQKLCGRCLQLNDGTVSFDGITEKCISAYLHDGSASKETQSVKIFNNVKTIDNASVVLRKIHLLSLSGEETSNFRIDESIKIEIECTIISKISNFHLYAKIFTNDGTLAFATADWDIDEIHENKFPKGNYKAIFIIPSHLLNAGSYYLSLDGLIPNHKYLFQESFVLAWSVTDRGGAGGLHSITRKGLFRPLIKWDTTIM